MKIDVRAHEIAGLLDRLPEGATILSLDCFDTLIWRAVHSPRDVFTGIDMAGGALEPRIWAESATRRIMFNRHRRAEITLSDVYRRLLPNADEAGVAAGVDHELAIEASHCFAFTPVVELMREATRRGLRIVIVSDMYLSEAQLRALIASTAGEDVLAMVERVFVSAEYGCGKTGGLFDHVLAETGAQPAQIFHLGDNFKADCEVPASLGIHVAHFRQFDAVAEQRLRLEAGAAAMIDPATRISRPVMQPHRAQVSLRADDDPVYALGHDVIGPVLHSFAHWLKAEIDEMSARLGKPVRPLFMMRDGYLPYRVFDAMFPEIGGRPVEISRFVATRASLHDMAALEAHVVEAIGRLPLKALGRQLMLFDNEMTKIVDTRPGTDPDPRFAKAVLSGDTARRILSRSAKFADKLMDHLTAADVRDGDAVMLVDIGYNGTVQNILDPVLRKRRNLTVAGRYMFLREEQQTGLDKRGMLDVRNYECRTLQALSTCVAVIEQLCNIAQGSTIDYAADGTPIRERPDVKGEQNATRDRIQRACLDYVRDADKGVLRAARSVDLEGRRQAAAAMLARLFFMPVESEVEIFETFNQDVNMGTDQHLKLLDKQDAASGLRRRGLSYVNEVSRMYVPGEIQPHGLPLNLSLFSSLRFALDLRSSDFDVGGVRLPVILADAQAQTMIEITAMPTSEGFYRALVPIGRGRFTAAVQLGALCETVQIEDVRFHIVADLDAHKAKAGTPAVHVADAMTLLAPDLYQAGANGLLMVPPPAGAKDNLVLAIIFRPIRWRSAAAKDQTAARAA